MTPLPPSPFLSAAVPPAETPAAALASHNYGERDPAVMLDSTSGVTAAASSVPQSDAAATISEPSMTMEEAQEAPAPDALNPHESAGALETDHIHEIFFYGRKLMREPPSFVIDEGSFMAEVEEAPLFIRDGEHLRRWAS